MARTIGVIQGRMASTRLPVKLLAPIARRPMLEVIATRLAGAQVDEWWMATTTDPADDVAVAWAERLGLRVHRGDTDDVLSRFVAIAEMRAPAWIVRVTADDPFVGAPVVDALLASRLAADVDHVGEDPSARRLPLGFVPELVRAEALLSLASGDLAAHHRAHVTSAVRATGRTLAFVPPAGWPERPEWRWTVDTADDLAMADAAFTAFGGAWAAISYPDMVRILDRAPEIVARNALVPQKALHEG